MKYKWNENDENPKWKSKITRKKTNKQNKTEQNTWSSHNHHFLSFLPLFTNRIHIYPSIYLSIYRFCYSRLFIQGFFFISGFCFVSYSGSFFFHSFFMGSIACVCVCIVFFCWFCLTLIQSYTMIFVNKRISKEWWKNHHHFFLWFFRFQFIAKMKKKEKDSRAPDTYIKKNMEMANKTQQQ